MSEKTTIRIAVTLTLTLASCAVVWMWFDSMPAHSGAPARNPSSASEPMQPSKAEWRKELDEGGRVEFVAPGGLDADPGRQLVAKASEFDLANLGPLDEPALTECRRRLKGMVDLYARNRQQFLAEPVPEDSARQEDWHEQAIKSHYMCLKMELVASAFADGKYWVFEPVGSRRYPSHIRYVELYGVKALGRDNVTVVVPVSLSEHPELARQGADWQDFLINRSRLFAEEFNSRSDSDRIAAIARHDDGSRQLEVLNARSVREGLTEEEHAAIDSERAEILRARFPRYCAVDRDRHLLYVPATLR